MDEKLKFTPSPFLLCTRLGIVICVIGFFIFTLLGTVDMRSDEQKVEEHNNQIINHELFDDAVSVLKQYRKDFRGRGITKISCISASSNGNINKAVLIIDGSGEEVCYTLNRTVRRWMYSAYNSYDYYSTELRVVNRLVLEGDDLTILYEEANG